MSPCPEAEALYPAFAAHEPEARAHVQGCRRCAALMEEHRLLEKDLSRLSDPLPPPELFPQLMLKVSQAPVLRNEQLHGAAILLATLVASALTFVLSGGTVARLGTGAAAIILDARQTLLAFAKFFSPAWSLSGGGWSVASAALLLMAVAFLRRRSLRVA